MGARFHSKPRPSVDAGWEGQANERDLVMRGWLTATVTGCGRRWMLPTRPMTQKSKATGRPEIARDRV